MNKKLKEPRELTHKEILLKMLEVHNELSSFIAGTRTRPGEYVLLKIVNPNIKEKSEKEDEEFALKLYPPRKEYDYQWTLCSVNEMVRIDYLIKIFEILNGEVMKI